MERNKNDIRKAQSWRSTDLPLTNNTVRVILSHSTDAKKLSKAIREARTEGTAEFTLTVEAADQLK